MQVCFLFGKNGVRHQSDPFYLHPVFHFGVESGSLEPSDAVALMLSVF